MAQPAQDIRINRFEQSHGLAVRVDPVILYGQFCNWCRLRDSNPRPPDYKFLVDAPLEAGDTGKEFRAVIEQKWLPAVTRFQPQLIVLSAGFDGHVLDDMSGIRLLEDDYAWLTRAVKGLAGQFADGRIGRSWKVVTSPAPWRAAWWRTSRHCCRRA